MLRGFKSNIYSSQKTIHLLLHNVSVNSKPDHPPGATPGNLHILVALGVEFSLLCLVRGSSRGDLKSKEKFDYFEKARFLLGH